jgi:hypothetical protein
MTTSVLIRLFRWLSFSGGSTGSEMQNNHQKSMKDVMLKSCAYIGVMDALVSKVDRTSPRAIGATGWEHHQAGSIIRLGASSGWRSID